ncbi:hypothetical protein JTE90_000476 [Oedothorax gibbosus]|uniref:Uncharacterized protein n=1 Tax=Oedothorax gibbosus TaxID=931172 RepID=A0AAV6TZG2_9ARAC|nr:hypothetical protein JTE90_000476 [Oedothorax gibbosus]
MQVSATNAKLGENKPSNRRFPSDGQLHITCALLWLFRLGTSVALFGFQNRKYDCRQSRYRLLKSFRRVRWVVERSVSFGEEFQIEVLTRD